MCLFYGLFLMLLINQANQDSHNSEAVPQTCDHAICTLYHFFMFSTTEITLQYSRSTDSQHMWHYSDCNKCIQGYTLQVTLACVRLTSTKSHRGWSQVRSHKKLSTVTRTEVAKHFCQGSHMILEQALKMKTGQLTVKKLHDF